MFGSRSKRSLPNQPNWPTTPIQPIPIPPQYHPNTTPIPPIPPQYHPIPSRYHPDTTSISPQYHPHTTPIPHHHHHHHHSSMKAKPTQPTKLAGSPKRNADPVSESSQSSSFNENPLCMALDRDGGCPPPSYQELCQPYDVAYPAPPKPSEEKDDMPSVHKPHDDKDLTESCRQLRERERERERVADS